MRTFSKRFVSTLVLLVAAAALTVVLQPATACTGNCTMIGCVYSSNYTGMTCEDLPGGMCVLYQCYSLMQKSSEAVKIREPFTTEIAPLTLAKQGSGEQCQAPR